MTNHVDKVLAEVLRDLLGYRGPVSDDLTPAQVKGWDSVAHISIIEELESRLGIRLSTEEMVAMQDVGTIRTILNRHGVAA